MPTVRVLVVDDHPPIRSLLRMVGDQVGDFEVIGDSGDGVEAVRLTRELQPDVLVLDAVLPGFDCARIIRAVRAQSPRTRILVYTGYADDHLARAILRLGVDGYVVKGAPLGDLLAALRRVYRGKRYVDPEVAGRLLFGASSTDRVHLTSRDLDVLRLVARGKRDDRIASELGVSVHTIHCYVKRLLLKLGATNRTELAWRARDRTDLGLEPVSTKNSRRNSTITGDAPSHPGDVSSG